MNRLFAATDRRSCVACAGVGLARAVVSARLRRSAPLLAAASKEIGEANLRCITFSGTGYDGAVGQTAEYTSNIDWPRIDALANYTRTINWETGTSKETFDRKPGLNPASWKYGLGWRGGTPIQKQTRQTHIVNGSHAWYIDGEGGEPVAVPPRMPSGISSICGSTRPASSRRRACRAPTRRRSGAGSRSRWAATATSSRPRRCTSCRSRCSASTASRRRSTRRTRFSASRRRSASRRSATSTSSTNPPSRRRSAT